MPKEYLTELSLYIAADFDVTKLDPVLETRYDDFVKCLGFKGAKQMAADEYLEIAERERESSK